MFSVRFAPREAWRLEPEPLASAEWGAVGAEGAVAVPQPDGPEEQPALRGAHPAGVYYPTRSGWNARPLAPVVTM